MGQRATFNIGIVTAGLAINPQMFGATALGGSESALICMARALGMAGQRVTVFCVLDGPQGQRDPLSANVQYFHVNDFDQHIALRNFDVMIVSRHIGYALKPIRAGALFYWAHDIAPQSGFDGSIWPLDRMLFLSQYHQGLYEAVLPPGFTPFMRTTRNGIELDRILRNPSQHGGFCKSGTTFCYTSRPERGAMFLLGSIWPRIRQLIPDATLDLAWYEIKNMTIPADVQRDIDFTMQLVKDSASLGVRYHGALAKDDLYTLMGTCNALLYPCIFPESSCITAIEAMALGTFPITTNRYALPETCGEHGWLIDGVPGSSDYDEAFIDAVLHVAANYGEQHLEAQRVLMTCHARRHHDWNTIAAEWVAALDEFFTTRLHSQRDRIYDNLLYHSDALTLQGHLEDRLAHVEDLIATDEDRTLAYLQTTQTILDRSQDQTDDYLASNSHQNWRDNARSLTAIKLLAPALERATTVLDVGCGSGNFLACLHVQYPHLTLVGVDFSATCLEEARAFIMQEGLDTTKFTFHHRTIEEPWPAECFDAVHCGEVLEHLADTQAMLTKLESTVKDGGMVCLTTPLGPWSAISARKEGPRNIERHLHHFRMTDLQEILSGRGTTMTMEYLSAGLSNRGEPIGNILTAWVVAPARQPFGHVDLARKVRTTRPYQKLSAVMIVKDDETTILRCLKSLQGLVDELIIGNTGSTDSTIPQVLFFSQTSHLPITVLDIPFDIDGDGIGNFSAWRNAVLRHATGDWILAIDADEILANGQALRRYLDTPSLNAYAMNQLNICLDRPADRAQPQRLFRNHRGYQYRGCIHEHLHTAEPGFQFVEPFLILEDVTLPHDGYLMESTRYQKTAIRNLPMLRKDRILYPDRAYGQLLEMRDVLNICRWAKTKLGGLRQMDVDALRQLLVTYEATFSDPGNFFYADATRYQQDALALLALLNVLPLNQRHVPLHVQIQVAASIGPLTQHVLDRAQPTQRWFRNVEGLRDYLLQQTTLLERSLGPLAQPIEAPLTPAESLLKELTVP